MAEARNTLLEGQSDQGFVESHNGKLPRHRWTSVASSGEPLSDLERRALSMSSPTDLFPMTGRAAAIARAVEMELGCIVGDVVEAEPVEVA